MWGLLSTRSTRLQHRNMWLYLEGWRSGTFGELPVPGHVHYDNSFKNLTRVTRASCVCCAWFSFSVPYSSLFRAPRLPRMRALAGAGLDFNQAKK